MFSKKSSKSGVIARLFGRLSLRRVGKALGILFKEGPGAMLRKSLEANYIDSDFSVFIKSACSGLFLTYDPKYENEAASLASGFAAHGIKLDYGKEKCKKGVSFMLFPEDDAKPGGIYIIINRRPVKEMSEAYIALLRSAYEVIDCETANFAVWEKRELLARLPYFMPEGDGRDFYLSRFLLAQELISFEDFFRKNAGDFAYLGERVCLSLKETPSRLENFTAQGIAGFSVFPGLRHRLGFLGCALSYKFLIKLAKDSRLGRILISEDDAVFPQDFDERFKKISSFLEGEEFDIFSGLLAESENADILDFFPHEGERIVLTDRLMSMVFNVYSEHVYDNVLSFDESDRDPFKNTIDRFLCARPLKIFCALPFLVRHNERGGSTLWNKSSHYEEMIEKSEKTLELKLTEFLKRK